MSSEQLADGVNPLDAELAATWDVLKGYSGRDTDLGVARRFGGAAAAYSLRDIGAMNGRVVRVRRDSDNAEEDFSANQVASGALEDFVGSGNDGFVSIWYDQSGNSNNATQTSIGEQPNIVSNGDIIKNANGNPSLEFDGSGKHLEYGNVTSNINTISSFIYLERTAASGAEIVTSQGSSATTPASRWYTPFFNSAVAYLGYGAAGSTALNLGTVSTLTPTLLSFACGESNVEGFANGTSKGTLTLEDASTTSVTNDDIGKFGTSGGFEYTGRITEYFIYASKLQSDVDTINDEINNHYNIY